ncbi:MAG: hemerythrin domain-containing protein [Deltaproteobacteria bacterium]|nr:hemerythrin domain-containing protein [Deltaproteobacteria bacterium]
MWPIGPLMWEHRLIERLVRLLASEAGRWRAGQAGDPALIYKAVEFFRNYADRCHHGKEEEILFETLSRRDLAPEHSRVMAELLNEHRQGRALVGRLDQANRAWEAGDAAALPTVLACLEELTVFYPAHIIKEDQHFFYPVMEYFNRAEKDAMLEKFWEFDRQLVHEFYGFLVKGLEESAKRPAAPPPSV